MSRIYFHTPEETAEVRGSEYAYMRGLVTDLALAVLDVHHDDRGWLRSVIRGADYDVLSRYDWWERDFATWFSVSTTDGGLLVGGEVVGKHELAANTVIDMGSPTLVLVARLEGMCEDHAWIDPADAGWFADLVEKGRRSNILRADQGWEEVVGLARGVEAGEVAGPIVTSYSVCESFPNAEIADWEAPQCEACKGDGEPNDRMRFQDVEYDHCTSCDGDGVLHDAWDELLDAERWRLAEAGMKARKYNRQISPGTAGVGFMSGASIFDLMAERWAERMAALQAEAARARA